MYMFVFYFCIVNTSKRNSFKIILLPTFHFVWFQRHEARNKWKNWRKMTGNKIFRPLYSLNLVDHCTRFLKMSKISLCKFAKDINSSWRAGKLAIVHKFCNFVVCTWQYRPWTGSIKPSLQHFQFCRVWLSLGILISLYFIATSALFVPCGCC
jgi:hypothetical protein